MPHAQNFGRNFIDVDDNTRPRRAGIVNEIFEEHSIARMDWPPQSWDCNSIKHVWDHLQRRLDDRDNPPFDLNQLKIALVEEWNAIEQNYANNIIDSLPRRCLTVHQTRGRPTRH